MHRVSFVKVDVQGVELQVPREMQDALARRRYAYLLLKFASEMLHNARTDPKEVIAFLHNLGVFSHAGAEIEKSKFLGDSGSPRKSGGVS